MSKERSAKVYCKDCVFVKVRGDEYGDYYQCICEEAEVDAPFEAIRGDPAKLNAHNDCPFWKSRPLRKSFLWKCRKHAEAGGKEPT